MRVLVFNFIQPDDRDKAAAGGVGIYQQNLIGELCRRGCDVISLSSGDRDDFTAGPARLEIERGDYTKARIINSPMLAPTHKSFAIIREYYESDLLNAIPSDIKSRFRSIEVFHFQNVEGLTAGFFRNLPSEFPRAQMIVSAHNYNLVCPQVNLWQREATACTDYHEGRACVNCLLTKPPANEKTFRRYHAMLRFWHVASGSLPEIIMRKGILALKRWGRLLRRGPSSKRTSVAMTIISEAKADQYKRYRHENIALAENVFDRVLAVSSRTRQVLIDRGVPASRISVSYIGTAHAHYFDPNRMRVRKAGKLNVAFLGYMRADKGFFFLLNALSSLPQNISKQMSVTIAAPIQSLSAIKRLEKIAYRFREIKIYDGYSHQQLDIILEDVDVGIVPALWEDNLPQVAIEMVSRNIAILCSDRGGAQEIARHPDFVFQAGSRDDFVLKITRLITGEVHVNDFFQNKPTIVSMSHHVDDLMRHYQARSNEDISPDAIDEKVA